jgi:hypothetical protein
MKVIQRKFSATRDNAINMMHTVCIVVHGENCGTCGGLTEIYPFFSYVVWHFGTLSHSNARACTIH